MEYVLIAIAILVVALIAGVGLLVGRGRRTARLDEDAAAGTTLTRPRPPESPAGPGRPGRPRRPRDDAPARGAARPPVELPPAEPEPGLTFETPPPSAGRLVRLRSRLARSQSSLGRGLLTVLAREQLTEDDWEEVEETLLAADVGVAATTQIVERLRTQSLVLATASGQQLRELLVRGADRRPRARPGPVAGHRPPRGPARRGARRRRQRRRQDDDGRQDRAGARRRREERRARCRRHLPRRGRRPAGDVGRAGGRAHRARPRGRRPGVGGLRGGAHRDARARSTPSSSTPPAGCTPSRA